MRAHFPTMFVLLLAVVLGTNAVELGAMAAPSSAAAFQASTQGQDADEPSNFTCPVMPDEAIDPAIFTEYAGTKVYFCCRRCLRQFERDPEQYLANLAWFVPQDEHAHVHDDQPQDHSDDLESDGDAVMERSPSTEQQPQSHTPHEHAQDTTQDGAGVAHEHDDHDDSELPAFLQWLGKFHPASIVFPIAMLIGAATAELLLILTKRDSFNSAARYCLWVGAVGALGAGILGWLFGGFHLTDDDWILTTHRWLGTATVTIALVALAVSEAHHRAPESMARAFWYRTALFAGALLVSVTGFFGGAMLYGIDHYRWSF